METIIGIASGVLVVMVIRCLTDRDRLQQLYQKRELNEQRMMRYKIGKARLRNGYRSCGN